MWFLPGNESELEDALNSGAIEESHFLDFKEALPDGESGNKAIAKDLASFSIDGGRMIVGVAETPDGLVPRPLNVNSLGERVERIALSRVEPPVFIFTTAIPSEKQPGLGYLVINIPASDFAPHMVDSRYMARNDKTQRPLTHPEVLRFHERHATRLDSLNQSVMKQISRDPVPIEIRTYPHLHLVATPRLTSKPLLLETLRNSEKFNILRGWLKLSSERLPKVKVPPRNTFLSLVQSPALRHDGVALFSGNIHQNRAFKEVDARRPEQIVEIEFSQDGQLRFFNAQIGYSPVNDGVESGPRLVPEWAIEQGREFLELVYVCSSEVHYGGRWDISIAITGIGGMEVHRGDALWFDSFRYESNAEDYIAHVSGDLNELENNVGGMLEVLLGRFARSLDMEAYFQSYFD